MHAVYNLLSNIPLNIKNVLQAKKLFKYAFLQLIIHTHNKQKCMRFKSTNEEKYIMQTTKLNFVL